MERLPVKTLKANPNNPRVIRDEKFKKLVKSIKEFPEMLEARPVVVNPDMVVLGGNMRLKALREAGVEEAPVYIASWDEVKQRQFIIKDNVGFGEWDWDALANEWNEEELQDWGLDIPGFEEMQEVLEAEEDDFDVPDEIKTDIVLGDLFEIGEHRLLCGDSTDFDQVSKLMNGEQADMVFTDPPYGVDYHSQNSTMYYGKGKKGKERERIIGDKDASLYAETMPIMCMFSVGPLYVFCGAGNEIEVLRCVENNNIKHINTLIWDKMRFGGQAIGANYKPCFEMFYYLLPQGNDRNWCGENNEETIWRLKRDSKTDLHPTQKPVELPERALKNHNAKNVLDLFLGSGSTMVAAHQLGRKCYGMELDPKYCQVIVDRMHKLDPSLQIKRNGQPYEANKTEQ